MRSEQQHTSARKRRGYIFGTRGKYSHFRPKQELQTLTKSQVFDVLPYIRLNNAERVARRKSISLI